MPSDKYGSLWSRDELILALYLYCQIPFAKTKANNPEVIRLSKLLGRTPASVARKLGNFGAFDPPLAQQGISGLIHFSKADRLIWEEFQHRWEALVQESNRLLGDLNARTETESLRQPKIAEDVEERIIVRPTGPSEREAIVSVRLFQSFFRRTVLASYGASCCFCGLNLRCLLVAGHIVPWSVDESARTEPENGLCLCALHDRAFDCGVVTISESLDIVVGREALASKQEFVRASLVSFHQAPLRKPNRFAPNERFLAWHREHVFKT